MVKIAFHKMVPNVMHWHTSKVQTAQDIFRFIQRILPKLPCVNTYIARPVCWREWISGQLL